jgi:hypothetical protein
MENNRMSLESLDWPNSSTEILDNWIRVRFSPFAFWTLSCLKKDWKLLMWLQACNFSQKHTFPPSCFVRQSQYVTSRWQQRVQQNGKPQFIVCADNQEGWYTGCEVYAQRKKQKAKPSTVIISKEMCFTVSYLF